MLDLSNLFLSAVRERLGNTKLKQLSSLCPLIFTLCKTKKKYLLYTYIFFFASFYTSLSVPLLAQPSQFSLHFLQLFDLTLTSTRLAKLLSYICIYFIMYCVYLFSFCFVLWIILSRVFWLMFVLHLWFKILSFNTVWLLVSNVVRLR